MAGEVRQSVRDVPYGTAGSRGRRFGDAQTDLRQGLSKLREPTQVCSRTDATVNHHQGTHQSSRTTLEGSPQLRHSRIHFRQDETGS